MTTANETERTEIYRQIDGDELRKIYDNGNGTFDAFLIIDGEVAAEWENCPSFEYAFDSLFDER